MLLVIGELVHHIAELVAVLQGGHLDSANVLLLFLLVNTHQLVLLLKAHNLALDPLEDFVEEHGGCITLSVDHLVVLLGHLQSLLQYSDSLLKLMVQSL